MSLTLEQQIIALIQAYILKRFTFKDDALAIMSAELNIVEFEVMTFVHESKIAYVQLPLVVTYCLSVEQCLVQINSCYDVFVSDGTYHPVKSKQFINYFRRAISEMTPDNPTFQPFKLQPDLQRAYS